MPSSNVNDRVLVRMLACLNARQRKAFKEYLACSLFNTNPTLLTLFNRFDAKVLRPNGPPISEAKLLKGTGIKVALMDKLCSQLMAQLDRFIPLWAQRDNPKTEFPIALHAWHEMGLAPDLLERQYRKMKRKMEKLPASEFDLLHAFQLEHHYLQYQVKLPRREQSELFKAQHALLDTFYLVSRLRYLCGSIVTGRIFREEGDQLDLELDAVQGEMLPPVGQAYLAAYRLLRAEVPQLADAEALLARLEQEGQAFSREDREDLYGYLLNSGIRGMAKESAFEDLLHRIYNALLRHGLLTANGQIAGGHFKNIVSLKIRLGALAEAKQFIRDYQDQLIPSERSVLLPYADGLMAYHGAAYQEAIRHFRGIVEDAPEDLFWGLQSRYMLWRAYFEAHDTLSMAEHEEMLRLYDSFRVFVARNTLISDHHKTRYENFIRIFNRLIRIGDKNLWAATVPELEALQVETEHTSQLPHKKWLLEVIARKIQATK